MDLAFQSIGSNGKFQKTMSVIVIVVASLTLFYSINFAFLTYRPNFLCREMADYNSDFHHCYEEQLCKSNIYEYLKLKEESINNWAYDFDLYCDKAYFIPLIGTAFFFGGIAGSVVLSPLPDKYGREGIYKILLGCSFILHVLVLFSFNEIQVVIINFLGGFVGYCYSMSTLIITEYLDRDTAGTIMSINNAVFPTTGIICAFFFIYINNWRLLFTFTSILSFIVAYVAYKNFLESPRWLNSKNRIMECLQVFKKIAEINGNEKLFQKFMEVNSGK